MSSAFRELQQQLRSGAFDLVWLESAWSPHARGRALTVHVCLHVFVTGVAERKSEGRGWEGFVHAFVDSSPPSRVGPAKL